MQIQTGQVNEQHLHICVPNNRAAKYLEVRHAVAIQKESMYDKISESKHKYKLLKASSLAQNVYTRLDVLTAVKTPTVYDVKARLLYNK